MPLSFIVCGKNAFATSHAFILGLQMFNSESLKNQEFFQQMSQVAASKQRVVCLSVDGFRVGITGLLVGVGFMYVWLL